MTLCKVVSRGTENDRKTTASQLGWTQDLPGARHITVAFGQAAFLKMALRQGIVDQTPVLKGW